MGAHILHLIASNFVSGPEKQILHHARDMAGSPYSLSIASFQDLSAEPQILQAGRAANIPSYCLRGEFNPLLVTDLTTLIRQEKIGILCTHGYKANIVGRGAALLTGVPQVAFVRGWTAETPRVAFYEKIERRVLRSAPWVVCVSALQAEQLSAARKGRRQPVVIPNAVLAETPGGGGLSLSRADAGIPEKAFVFGSAGRLSIEKGHKYLLDAFAFVCRNNPGANFYLVLLGEGRELASLQEQAQQLGIMEKVLFPGFKANCREWMRLFSCMVQPSLTEGTPNSVLEALRENIPVIASAVGGVPDLIRDGQSGLLVTPQNPQALAVAMERIANSADLRAKLAHGIDTLDPRYKPEIQRASLIRLYDAILSSGGYARD